MPLFNIGFVIFPNLTQLDFTGPLQVLSRLPQSATRAIADLTSRRRIPLRVVRLSTCSAYQAEAKA